MKQLNFTKIDSTNDIARSLIENESELIVTAEQQTKGRGRMNRQWLGDFNKNLYFTYAVNHSKIKTFEEIKSYLAAGSLFILETFRFFAPSHTFKIKYPNDIYVLDNNNYMKIAGILTEHVYFGSAPKYSIIGIGANINQVDFPREIILKASSLSKIGINISTKVFSQKLISYFETIYSHDERTLFNQWRDEINVKGKECLLLSQNRKMKVKELLDDGRLLLLDKDGEIIIDDGESITYDL